VGKFLDDFYERNFGKYVTDPKVTGHKADLLKDYTFNFDGVDIPSMSKAKKAQMRKGLAKLNTQTPYPKTDQEFDKLFATEKDCLDFILRTRGAWQNSGFVCRECGGTEFWECSLHGRFKCKKCRTNTSLLTNTIFEKSNIPLTTWFRALWHCAFNEYGISATNMQKHLGVSHKTAWLMLQKIRRAMTTVESGKLSGKVQADLFNVGGAQEGGKKGRGAENAKCYAAMERYGRLKMSVIDLNAEKPHNTKNFLDFVFPNIERGSHIITDGDLQYRAISQHGYRHSFKVGAHLPFTDMAIRQVKTFLGGTLLLTISGEHLQEYFDEFCFRYNRRNLERGELFYELLKVALSTPPTLYREVVKDCSIWKKGHRAPRKNQTETTPKTTPKTTMNDPNLPF